jgi:hypothetical protein
MNPKLRTYLKSRGISDEAISKLSRGEVPDDDATLRKQTSDSPSPLLEKMRKVDDLLREITERLERIEKADAHRASVARGLEMFNAGKVNGIAALKGAAP